MLWGPGCGPLAAGTTEAAAGCGLQYPAGVAKLANATDLKSVAGNGLRVRSPPPALVAVTCGVLMRRVGVALCMSLCITQVVMAQRATLVVTVGDAGTNAFIRNAQVT